LLQKRSSKDSFQAVGKGFNGKLTPNVEAQRTARAFNKFDRPSKRGGINTSGIGRQFTATRASRLARNAKCKAMNVTQPNLGHVERDVGCLALRAAFGATGALISLTFKPRALTLGSNLEAQSACGLDLILGGLSDLTGGGNDLKPRARRRLRPRERRARKVLPCGSQYLALPACKKCRA
jgi:hypothetical protein